MEREADVMVETLAPICSEIPSCLRGRRFTTSSDISVNPIIYRNGRTHCPCDGGHSAEFIKNCVANGYDPIDMKPSGNVLLTRHGITVIDYEFWRRCDPAMRPEDCYCLAGLPKDYAGDRPRGVLFLYDPYPAQWFRFTALSVESFLYDPAWLQQLKRGAHLLRGTRQNPAPACPRPQSLRRPSGLWTTALARRPEQPALSKSTLKFATDPGGSGTRGVTPEFRSHAGTSAFGARASPGSIRRTNSSSIIGPATPPCSREADT